MKKLVLIGLSASIITGCGVVSGGKKDYFTILRPPIQNVDLSELAANLRDDQGLIIDYNTRSLQPGSDIVAGEGAQLTPELALNIYKSGLAAGQSSDDALKVLGEAIQKNRTVDMTITIAGSKELVQIVQANKGVVITPNVIVRRLGEGSTLTNIVTKTPETPVVVTNPATPIVVVPEVEEPVVIPPVNVIPIVVPQSGLWKPLGDDNSGSRILLPNSMTAPLPDGPYSKQELDERKLMHGDYVSNVLSVDVDSTTGGHHGRYNFTGLSNGWRETYRHNATGNDWMNGRPAVITVKLKNGQTKTWVVDNPAQRLNLN